MNVGDFLAWDALQALRLELSRDDGKHAPRVASCIMQRIVVMGPPGSGKSTLARQLGTRHTLPVFHLDQLYYQPGWIEVPPNVFHAEVKRIDALPAWVVGGNYAETIEPRFRSADTVIYLDDPTWLCMVRVVRRIAVGYGRVRLDVAPGCAERFDPGFLCFVWSWNRMRRSSHLALVRSFPGRQVILQRRRALHDRFAD